ncbi:MAG: hypothetical protein F6J93_17860 [Oscillatoria sp. SIO1A7]|nr:hypothetical protein [Oscillatoria sp. SIO1A7]
MPRVLTLEGFHSNWRLPGDRHDEYAETPLTLGLSGSRKRIGKWDEFSPHPTPYTLHPTPHAQCPMPNARCLGERAFTLIGDFPAIATTNMPKHP